MVDLSERVEEIKKLVDDGKYFTINRARQYGKTTTLNALQQYLSKAYEVVSLSFEGISQAGFKDERSFVRAFCRKLKRELRNGLSVPEDIENQLNEILARTENRAELDELSDLFEEWCSESERKVVLLIDEVDTAANNQVFLDFLACLRDSYINRETKSAPAFQSVILAGVTDVKHLKAKIRPEDAHKVNSPWNIAADFDIEMSLSVVGIKGMLDEYEADHHTGMDTAGIAATIRGYTNGYPYLVSRICQIIDEKLIPVKFDSPHEAWTDYGVDEAVKRLLSETAVKRLLSETGNTLFDSLTGKLFNYPELKQKLRNVLLHGETLAWLPYDHEQQQLYIYGFIRNNHNTVAISNRVFEMLLYAHFIGESDKI